MILLLLPVGTFLIGIVETLIIAGVLYLVGFFIKKTSLRYKIFFLITYPGLFFAVGGYAGIVLPLPAIIGLPVEIPTLFTAKADDFGWFPSPFSIFAFGIEKANRTLVLIFLADITLFFGWFLITKRIQNYFNMDRFFIFNISSEKHNENDMSQRSNLPDNDVNTASFWLTTLLNNPEKLASVIAAAYAVVVLGGAFYYAIISGELKALKFIFSVPSIWVSIAVSMLIAWGLWKKYRLAWILGIVTAGIQLVRMSSSLVQSLVQSYNLPIDFNIRFFILLVLVVGFLITLFLPRTLAACNR